MGWEYKIAFPVGDPEELEAFLVRLREMSPQNQEGAEYTVFLEQDGFYFCDHTKSANTSWVFRRLIDKGLNKSDSVVIQDL